MKGRTSIVIAHRLSTVRSLDRIWCSTAARSSSRAPTPALTARPGGLYRGLFERQVTEFGRITAAE